MYRYSRKSTYPIAVQQCAHKKIHGIHIHTHNIKVVCGTYAIDENISSIFSIRHNDDDDKT